MYLRSWGLAIISGLTYRPFVFIVQARSRCHLRRCKKKGKKERRKKCFRSVWFTHLIIPKSIPNTTAQKLRGFYCFTKLHLILTVAHPINKKSEWCLLHHVLPKENCWIFMHSFWEGILPFSVELCIPYLHFNFKYVFENPLKA